MDDEILDNINDANDPDNSLIAIKYFYFETKARLYSARLEAEGIPSFVANSNAITAVPLGSPGIGLHIRKGDLKRARDIVIRMDQRAEMELADEEESFRDADLDEINYQKALHEKEVSNDNRVLYLIAIIIIFVLIRMAWRALNPGETLWDVI